VLFPVVTEEIDIDIRWLCNGAQMAQLLEMPNERLPMNSIIGTIIPINGPAIYQGQGW
jgi:hypothetical protein